MRYNTIRKMDVSNGEGVRVSLFTQGCDLHCPDCFNKVAWDYNGGKVFTLETIEDIISLMEEDYIKGLSILGGEPFSLQNKDMLLELVVEVKEALPDKTIWIWSGHQYEELIKDDDYKDILSYCDVLIDGPFIKDLKDDKLEWRGSSNQRVIKLKDLKK